MKLLSLPIALTVAAATLGAQQSVARPAGATRAGDSVVTGTAAGRTGGARSAATVAADSAIAQLQDFLNRYPNSALRPNALFQIGELLVRRADEQFEQQQRSGNSDVGRPDYAPAIARYEELVRRYPNFEKIDAAAYTLGTLYYTGQRYPDAARMFEIVAE